MALKKLTVWGIVCTMGACIFGSSSHALPTKTDIPNRTPRRQIFTWYDGNRKQKTVLDPELLAEFNSNSSSKKSHVKNSFPDAELKLSQNEHVKIWKLKKTDGLRAFNRLSHLTDRQNGNSSFSPVFEDGENGSGIKRALPGGIIITLNPQWSPEQIDGWLAKKNLKLIRRMENRPNVLLVDSPSGLVSLRTANHLYESGEVETASPNWWKESVKR